MWSTILLPLKLTELLGNLSIFQILKINKTDQMFNISVNYRKHKEGRPQFGKLNYQLSEIKDDIQIVSLFPCLSGHPVTQSYMFRINNIKNLRNCLLFD